MMVKIKKRNMEKKAVLSPEIKIIITAHNKPKKKI